MIRLTHQAGKVIEGCYKIKRGKQKKEVEEVVNNVGMTDRELALIVDSLQKDEDTNLAIKVMNGNGKLNILNDLSGLLRSKQTNVENKEE